MNFRKEMFLISILIDDLTISENLSIPYIGIETTDAIINEMSKLRSVTNATIPNLETGCS
jgi:hypothetical protein